MNKQNVIIYNFDKRIIIIGDSFTEGIGFEYKDTFVGLLDQKNSIKNTQILNAGVASQSPIIYFKKIKHLIEVKKVEFDELIVFLDISVVEFTEDKKDSMAVATSDVVPSPEDSAIVFDIDLAEDSIPKSSVLKPDGPEL